MKLSRKIKASNNVRSDRMHWASSSGVTLIEVIIAVGVLGLLVFGLMEGFRSLFDNAAQARLNGDTYDLKQSTLALMDCENSRKANATTCGKSSDWKDAVLRDYDNQVIPDQVSAEGSSTAIFERKSSCRKNANDVEFMLEYRSLKSNKTSAWVPLTEANITCRNPLQLCTIFPPRDFIIFGGCGLGSTGSNWQTRSRNFMLPADAVNIQMTVVRTDVDDNSPSLVIEGKFIWGISEPSGTKNHMGIKVDKDVSSHMKAGATLFTSTVYDIDKGDCFATEYWMQGSYNAAVCASSLGP